MATKTSPRRAAKQTRDRIVRCDESLAILLGLPVEKPVKDDRR